SIAAESRKRDDQCRTPSSEEPTDAAMRSTLVTRRFVSRFMPARKPLRSSSKRISRLIRRNVGVSPFSIFPATCSAKPPPQPPGANRARRRSRRTGRKSASFTLDELTDYVAGSGRGFGTFIRNADRRLKTAPSPPRSHQTEKGARRVGRPIVHGDFAIPPAPS